MSGDRTVLKARPILADQSSRVIRRLGASIVGPDGGAVIRHDECEATWAEADTLAGRRVDRRRAYCIMPDDSGHDALHSLVRWSQHCTGCTDTPEMTTPAHRGSGCRECGYTGRVRCAYWVDAQQQGGGNE